MTAKQRWEKTSLHNKALVVIGSFAALGTIFYAGAAAIQVCIMRESAKEAAAQIDRLVAATNNAITNAISAGNEATSKALQENKESMSKALGQNDKSLASTIKQSKAVMDASIEASRRDQRAWVGLESRIIIDYLAISPRLGVMSHYAVKNFGHGPAFKVTTTGFFETDGKLLENTRNFTCSATEGV